MYQEPNVYFDSGITLRGILKEIISDAHRDFHLRLFFMFKSKTNMHRLKTVHEAILYRLKGGRVS